MRSRSSSVRPRPIVLALAPPAPGGRPGAVPATAQLGGASLAQHLLTTLAQCDLPSPLVLTSPQAAPQLRKLLGPSVEVRGCTGTRLQVLAAALVEVTGTWVMILDSERALTPASVINEVLTAADDDVDGVVPTIDMTDSVKLTSDAGLRNVDRSTLASLQSPRLLRRTVLDDALRSATTGDDEILAALAVGARLRTVHGSHAGFAVVDRLGLWQAQIALGLARDTSHRHGLSRRS